MKKSTKDAIIIGFALFSMFFGAGNLIFPGFLGKELGTEFFIGIIGFILTGVGLPLLAILACAKGDGTFETLSRRIGPKFSIICTAALFTAIGPMLGIPRTAATTFELTINPFFPSIPAFVVMAGYFAINLFFVLGSTSIIDVLGKYLTPALLIILTILIVKGSIFPIGEIVNTNASSVLSRSLLEGYQTMDAIAALLFAGIITTSIKSKGYKNKEILPMILKSSLVAVIGLAFVYGGLMFLGAQSINFASQDISKTGLLLLLSETVLGKLGPLMIGIAMGLACLTTSIGLLSAGSTFFEKISNGKLPYKFNAIFLALISLAIACLGVDKIIVLSEPILNILYPVAITLIVTTLLSKYLNNIKAVRLSVYTSLVFGVILAIPGLNLTLIPLASLGFGWVIPTIIALIIGYIIN